MIDRGKKNVLGVMVNVIDYATATDKIIHAAKEAALFTVSPSAVHGIMVGALDRIHRYRLNHFDLVTPDGQPVRWALNVLHGAKLTDRVYGPTLMLHICERAAQENLPIYLYGSRPEVVEKLANNLRERFPGLTIVGAEPSLFRRTSAEEKQQIAKRIRESGARIAFIGLGCPRQEVWIYEYRDLIPMPMIAVGASFDFHAGTLAQAPSYLQRRGLEWVFRLIKEPRRLWRRYLLLNPAYLWLLFLQKTHIKTLDPDDAKPPTQEMFYG